MKLMRYPFKRWRAWWLANVWSVPTRKVVCFTCGNCGRELKKYFDEVLVIGGEDGDLLPNRWFTDADIENYFPERLDLTSGNLPEGIIKSLGMYYKSIIGDLDEEVYFVPTGSGETISSLIMAYPETKFIAVYNIDEATKYEENAPLNKFVQLHAYDVIMEGNEYEFEN